MWGLGRLYMTECQVWSKHTQHISTLWHPLPQDVVEAKGIKRFQIQLEKSWEKSQRPLDCRDEDTALGQEVPKLQTARSWKDEVEEISLYLSCSCALLLSTGYRLVRDRMQSRWPLSLTQHCPSCSLAPFQLGSFTWWLLRGCISSCPAVLCTLGYPQHRNFSASWDRPSLGSRQRNTTFQTQQSELQNLVLWGEGSWWSCKRKAMTKSCHDLTSTQAGLIRV